jgi:superfamily II DNA or RNA helicase
VLFATASLIGEGFDLPRLDTLVLSMPLSWKGRLVQYAGRLHRRHEAKGAALIYDYVDDNHAITNAMFRRRLAGYRELNYSVEMPPSSSTTFFDGDNPS